MFTKHSSYPQVKAFEPEVVEALGYKGAIAAADELRGLLNGSKTLPRKGMPAQQQALYSSLPQVWHSWVQSILICMGYVG